MPYPLINPPSKSHPPDSPHGLRHDTNAPNCLPLVRSALTPNSIFVIPHLKFLDSFSLFAPWRMPMTSRPSLVALSVSVCLLFWASGCASMKQSDTSRTGLEQLLISNAIDQSLEKVDFRPIAGAKVYLKTDLLECVDKNYAILQTKSKLLANQCTLVDSVDDAEVLLEIASGGVGTDRTEMVVGTPEIPLGLMGSIPKITVYERNKAMGTAKLAILATDVKSKQPVINSGFSLARSDHQHWTTFGMGPIYSGSVAEQIQSSTGQVDGFVVPGVEPIFSRTARR
jgi:hypothetical protein